MEGQKHTRNQTWESHSVSIIDGKPCRQAGELLVLQTVENLDEHCSVGEHESACALAWLIWCTKATSTTPGFMASGIA